MSLRPSPTNFVDDDDPFTSTLRESPESDVEMNKGPESRFHNSGPKQNTEQTREVMLQKELESVRSINKVIESVVSSLQLAKDNINTVSGTVNSASMLLNTWTRILSQTEHNQRLILNPNWKGASADMLEAENESIQKAQAQERRRVEEERRREELKKRAEDEERQRQAGNTVRGARGPTSRLRGSRGGHNVGPSSGTYSMVRGSQTSRGGLGIKGGLVGSRGRGRDLR